MPELPEPQGVVWIIGQPGHGKTTLKNALARRPSALSFVEVEGAAAGPAGARTAVLVVSAVEGPMPLTRDHLKLARQSGVARVVIFLNKMDAADKDLTELVEMELRELLNLCGFAGNKAVVVRGSAAKALEGDGSDWGEPAIDRLMGALTGAAPASGGGFFSRLFG